MCLTLTQPSNSQPSSEQPSNEQSISSQPSNSQAPVGFLYKIIMLPQQLQLTSQTLKSIAENLIGQTCYVDWPFLVEAIVVSVADLTGK